MVFQGSSKHEGPVLGWHLIGLVREVWKDAELVFPHSKEVKNILSPWLLFASLLQHMVCDCLKQIFSLIFYFFFSNAWGSRTSKNFFFNYNFDLKSFLKVFLAKVLISLYVIVLGATFWNINFIEVITNSWKSDNPSEKDVVFWKLWCLFVIINTIEFGFSTLLKQVGNFTRFDRKCSSKKSERTR